jgi:hypothetical protein
MLHVLHMLWLLTLKNDISNFLDIYYHTLFWDPQLNGASITPTSPVCALLPGVGNYEVGVG